jgi:hypothetical protein
MTRILSIAAVATLAACAGRGKPAEVPAATTAHVVEPAPVVTSDTDGSVVDTSAWPLLPPGERDEPTYGERMRGERPGKGEVAKAEMRRWAARISALDTSACPSADAGAYYPCWCRLVCGVRFEARAWTSRLSWPYAEVDGPGFEVAPDGHVTSCWHTGRGAPATHVICPTR